MLCSKMLCQDKGNAGFFFVFFSWLSGTFFLIRLLMSGLVDIVVAVPTNTSLLQLLLVVIWWQQLKWRKTKNLKYLLSIVLLFSLVFCCIFISFRAPTRDLMMSEMSWWHFQLNIFVKKKKRHPNIIHILYI